MVMLLIINFAWSVLMLALSHHLATQNALAFYPETLPTMWQAGIAAGLALLGMLPPFRKVRFGFLAASGTTMGLLIVPCIYALIHWPGGDDGGGLGWLVIMGGASVLSGVIALCTVGIGGSLRSGKNDDRGKPDRDDGCQPGL
jgi:hypothetical protein